jgi:uncharacterized cupredoxin-like copper-binding protein
MESTKQRPKSLHTTIESSRRAQRYQQRQLRALRRTIAVISAVILVIAVVVVVALSTMGNDKAPTPPFEGATLNVLLGDYSITGDSGGDLTAPAGQVRLQAFNKGGIVHNVGIRRGPISGDMQHGKSFTVDLGVLAPGTYELYCDIVGHVELGMVADLIVR